jgi:hypothetical protein
MALTFTPVFTLFCRTWMWLYGSCGLYVELECDYMAHVAYMSNLNVIVWLMWPICRTWMWLYGSCGLYVEPECDYMVHVSSMSNLNVIIWFMWPLCRTWMWLYGSCGLYVELECDYMVHVASMSTCLILKVINIMKFTCFFSVCYKLSSFVTSHPLTTSVSHLMMTGN